MAASPNAQAILKRVFGYDRFRGDQEAIIQHLAEGGDALVLMPTGGGKSLCYQIPALLRPGTGVVVSPLIALMQDQVSALTQLGVRAAALNSALSLDAARRVEQALLAGELDLLYVAPERLLTERFLALLARSRAALFAIDEAHCVSQWGHDFRPEYIQLDMLHERWPTVPRIALTATADVPTRHEITRRLRLEQARVFLSSFDRPNIRYRVVEKKQPRQQLLRLIREDHAEDSGIVYCLSRRSVEETAQFLRSQRLNALPYHAGLSPATRQEHQHRFLREDGIIMVATIAFGMGIDKPDVRFVAHLDLPKSLEAYYQETGRAGRDGQPAQAWMAYGLGDVVMLRRMLEESAAEEQFKRIEQHKLNAMLGYCESSACRRQVLLHYFGETTSERCGNCDTCLEPVPTWDGTEAARKALSCVYRTGQRFGSAYLVEVLLGKDLERIRQFGHDQVSTFGIGKELSATSWRSVFRQLVAQGLLAVDVEHHGALKLTPESRPVLRGETTLRLRRDPEAKRTPSPARASSPSRSDESPALWDALKRWRRELAQRHNIPPYAILNDASLRELVERRPRDAQQLLQISGIGTVKLERYGTEVLAIIARHAAQTVSALQTSAGMDAGNSAQRSATLDLTLELLQQGLDPATIAQKRQLQVETVYLHLCYWIEQQQLSIDTLIDRMQRMEIERAFRRQASEDGLKPVHQALKGRYPYGLLKCVKAAMRRPS